MRIVDNNDDDIMLEISNPLPTETTVNEYVVIYECDDGTHKEIRRECDNYPFSMLFHFGQQHKIHRVLHEKVKVVRETTHSEDITESVNRDVVMWDHMFTRIDVPSINKTLYIKSVKKAMDEYQKLVEQHGEHRVEYHPLINVYISNRLKYLTEPLKVQCTEALNGSFRIAYIDEDDAPEFSGGIHRHECAVSIVIMMGKPGYKLATIVGATSTIVSRSSYTCIIIMDDHDSKVYSHDEIWNAFESTHVYVRAVRKVAPDAFSASFVSAIVTEAVFLNINVSSLLAACK